MNFKYHKIGEFWVHFPDDLEEITDLLQSNGYIICETMDGDMVIMKPDGYPEMPFPDDGDEEDDWGDGYHPSDIGE